MEGRSKASWSITSSTTAHAPVNNTQNNNTSVRTDVGHLYFIKSALHIKTYLTLEVFILNVRIYEQVEGKIVWENAILHLNTQPQTKQNYTKKTNNSEQWVKCVSFCWEYLDDCFWRVYLVLECMEGFVANTIFHTLSDPTVNCPVSEVPAVWAVTKPWRKWRI